MSGEMILGVTGDAGSLLERVSCVGRAAVGERRPDGALYITLPVPEGASAQCCGQIAEYIMDRYEAKRLGLILLRQHGYLSTAQRQEAMKLTRRFDADREVGYPVRRQLIKRSLERYFEESDVMLIEGFVAFRLADYERLLGRLADRIVDAFLVQREYDEFVELLRYFVQTREERPSLVHVVVLTDGTYRVIDTQDNDVTRSCMEELREDAEELCGLTPDDLLISALVSVAPRMIVVHGRERIQNVELFNTVARVFDGAITYCSGCSMCMDQSRRT